MLCTFIYMHLTKIYESMIKLSDQPLESSCTSCLCNLCGNACTTQACGNVVERVQMQLQVSIIIHVCRHLFCQEDDSLIALAIVLQCHDT